MGKTAGYNSKTVAFTPDSSFGQKRSANQVVKWTPAI